MSGILCADAGMDTVADAWCGDATSVVEFLRPLREQLDSPGVLEVCVNRPGEMLVESLQGWQAMAAPALTFERCLSLATAVATFSDQQVNQERPLLAATLPSGERVQFVIPPAVPRGPVSITIRKPSRWSGGSTNSSTKDCSTARPPSGTRRRAHRRRSSRNSPRLRQPDAARISCGWRSGITRPSSSAERPARARPPS